jgi:hypothetical protein
MPCRTGITVITVNTEALFFVLFCALLLLKKNLHNSASGAVHQSDAGFW